MKAHLERSTLVHGVAEQLRQMIRRGDVEPGAYLPSRKELAAQFGVGVSTVHEAIQALAAVGLVASHPGKGTWVRHDALDTLIHPAEIEGRMGALDAWLVYEARSIIDTLDLGWRLLRTIPKPELKRIRPEYLEKYYSEDQ